MANKLKRKIMLRIYLEYGKNVVRRDFQYILAAVSVIVFSASVSMMDILNNLYHTSPSSLWYFARVALRDAEGVTLVVFAAALIFLAISSVKAANQWPGLQLPRVGVKWR